MMGFTPPPIANDRFTGSMQKHLLGALQRMLPRDVHIPTAYLALDGFLALRQALRNAQWSL